MNSASSPPIVSAGHVGPIALNNTNKTLAVINLSAGKWLVTGKMWADSVASQPTINTVVGCSMFKGSTLLDASAFNTPKVGGAGGTSAGVEDLSAVIKTTTPVKVTLRCDDFGSMAQSHNAVLTAIGG